MHKSIVGAKKLSLQKEVEPELEASTQPLVTHRSPNAPDLRPFPWRMLLTLVIGIPAAVFGLLVGGFGLLLLVFGGMDCGGGSSNSSPQKPPISQPAQPTSPR